MRRNGSGHDTSLRGLIDLYLLRCQVEGKSPSTTHAYAETLGRFLRFVRQEGFPEDIRRITPGHLYPYLGQFARLSLETRHRYFREVRCFFNWLVAAGYLAETPFRGLRNVRLPRRSCARSRRRTWWSSSPAAIPPRPPGHEIKRSFLPSSTPVSAARSSCSSPRTTWI